MHDYHIDINLCCLAVLFGYDYMFARKRKGRWFNVHAMGNLIVTLSAAPAVIATLSDPANSCNTEIWKKGSLLSTTTVLPICMINAIHVYHMIAFNNLTSQDYFHHLLFIPLIGFPTQIFSNYAGVLANYTSFFMSGLPGGIDYFLLYLVKNGHMDKLEEKKWSVFLNMWIRCPFITFTPFMKLMAWRYGHFKGNPLIILMTGALSAYNCIHYNAESIENYCKHKAIREEQLMGEELTPSNRKYGPDYEKDDEDDDNE